MTTTGTKIRIYSSSRSGEKTIITKDSFFEGEVVISMDEQKICFRKPTLDDLHARKVTKDCLTYRVSVNCDIPSGTYFSDEEESNEDILCFYYTES